MLARGLVGRRVTLCVPQTSTQHAAYSTISSRSALQKRFLLAVHNALKLYSPSLARSYATKQVTKKPAAKKTTTAKKPATKKPAPKKKSAAKKKPAPRKRKVAKKAAPKRKTRVLTEEQKAARKAASDSKKQREKLQKLKADALEPPKGKPATVWQLIVSENAQGKTGVAAPGLMDAAKAKYHGLSPAERETYNHTANQNKADNEVAHERWIKSHTPEQIRQANLARASLRRIAKKNKKPVSYRLIHDDRAPKRPVGAYTKFSVDRFASGDFTAIVITEATKLIATEWKELGSSEKKLYEARAESDRQAYFSRYKSAYGHDAPAVAKKA